MSAVSPFCQLIPVIYSIKCFCIPLVAAFLFPFTHVLLFLSLAFSRFSFHSLSRRQTKPGSKFIIYQVALKFMALKGWIRLSASTLSLVWVLRATEIVSLIGLIMFGPGETRGFISLPRNCFVRISRQRSADVFDVPVSGCESCTHCAHRCMDQGLFCMCESENEHKAVLIMITLTTKRGTHIERQTFPEAWADIVRPMVTHLRQRLNLGQLWPSVMHNFWSSNASIQRFKLTQ